MIAVDDFCITHGYEHMTRQFGNPIPYCAECEREREHVSMNKPHQTTSEQKAPALPVDPVDMAILRMCAKCHGITIEEAISNQQRAWNREYQDIDREEIRAAQLDIEVNSSRNGTAYFGDAS